MIRQLLIYMSKDHYEDVPPILEYQRSFETSNAEGMKHINAYIGKYKEYFKEKNCNKLQIIQLDVDFATGTVNVLMNETGKHPIKEKILINPKATEIRKNRPVTKSKYGAMPTAWPDGDVVIGVGEPEPGMWHTVNTAPQAVPMSAAQMLVHMHQQNAIAAQHAAIDAAAEQEANG